MSKHVVSVVRHEDTYSSLKKALELCDGLKEFNKKDKILIKPNIVNWDFDLPFPPYGVVTTTALIFALVRLLHEEGYHKIAIGEGTLSVTGTMAREIFKALGYEKLREKYGVEIVDFNHEKFEDVDFGGFKLSLAGRALRADRIINVPVLKTHNQCKVSLGIKNFKGCLDRKSKISCHNSSGDLESIFPRIAEKLPVALTIIDGIFALAQGPGITGKAVRKDILAASRDVLACDVVGAALLGHHAADVPHLKFYGDISQRNTDLSEIEVRGEPVEEHSVHLPYDWEWTEENSGPVAFKKRGITGLSVRKYDNSLCTACSKLYNPMLVLLMSAFRGEPFPGVEVITGKSQTASPGFEKTVLFGKCACLQNKDNPDIKKAIRINGCPPDIKKLVTSLKEEGIDCDFSQYVEYRHYLFNRYLGKEGFDQGLFIM
ncbi:MAG: DUF362 domain-containing protein [Bacillota bacterium]